MTRAFQNRKYPKFSKNSRVNSLVNNIKKLIKRIWTDETKKILRYIIKPTIITTVVGSIAIAVMLLIIALTGNFEHFIMATDIKYDSPLLNYLILVFLVSDVFIAIYGISLCMYKYRRPGKRDSHGNYVNGKSYKAFSKTFNSNIEE